MTGLPYVGAPVATDPDLAYQLYVQSIKDLDLDIGEIDSYVTSLLSGYATKSYVDTRDALLADIAYIQAKDNLRLKLAQKDVTNGIAGLDATGKVNPNRINLPITQRFFRGPWAPPSYHSAQDVTTETVLFTCPVTDPGFPYKIIASGSIDAAATVAGEYPVVSVRRGSSAGPVIAVGNGMAEPYAAVQTTQFATPGAYNYTIPAFATRVDAVLVGAGAGGQGGQSGFWSGQGGGAGTFIGSTLIRGTNITGSSITGVVGTPGNASPAGSDATGGTATTAASAGMTSMSAAGGTNGNNVFGPGSNGLGPSSNSFNGQAYPVGTTVTTLGAAANGPGGGGAGGSANGAGGAAGPGSVWFFAYNTPNINDAPVVVFPINVATQTVLTGPTTLYVTVKRSGAASTVSASAFKPSLHIMAVAA